MHTHYITAPLNNLLTPNVYRCDVPDPQRRADASAQEERQLEGTQRGPPRGQGRAERFDLHRQVHPGAVRIVAPFVVTRRMLCMLCVVYAVLCVVCCVLCDVCRVLCGTAC